jgi:hypothetical protein
MIRSTKLLYVGETCGPKTAALWGSSKRMPCRPIAWWCVAVLSLVLAGAKQSTPAPVPACAEDAGFVKETYTYKEVGDTKIQADVYQPAAEHQK